MVAVAEIPNAVLVAMAEHHFFGSPSDTLEVLLLALSEVAQSACEANDSDRLPALVDAAALALLALAAEEARRG